MGCRVGFVSLGCAKNQVDSETMLAVLVKAGCEITTDIGDCDVAVVNTCGFIESAKTEAIENIAEIELLKDEGKLRGIVVTGCLAERYKEEIEKSFPKVSAFLGCGSCDKIAEAVKAAYDGKHYADFADVEKGCMDMDRILSTPPYTAYIKIADGCDNRCAYCAIPYIRGNFRSRTMENIVAEAERLAENGVRELNVIAQDTTRYGTDIYGKPSLDKLLTKLCRIEKLDWIRVLYCYPDELTDDLIDVIAREDKIVKYIDLPIQHGSDKILKKMNRRGSAEHIRSVLTKIREKIPDVTIRSTVIVGFPGEGEKEFEELCEMIDFAKFEKLGVFTYSREEGTPAYKMRPQVDEDIKLMRQENIMMHQADISLAVNEKKLGKTVKVLVEGFDRYAESWFGRSEADAPDIDGKVFFTCEKKPVVGSFIDVTVTDVLDYDLIGEAKE